MTKILRHGRFWKRRRRGAPAISFEFRPLPMTLILGNINGTVYALARNGWDFQEIEKPCFL